MKIFKTYIFTLLILNLLPFEAIAQIHPGNNNVFDPYKLNGPLNLNDTEEDSNVTFVGKFGWGPCAAVGVKDNIACIGNGSLIQLLDISNPDSPEIISEVNNEQFVNDLTVEGNFIFSISPFKIIDISSPQNPVIISQINNIGGYNIRIRNGYAFLGDWDYVHIVDISDPYNLEVVSEFIAPDYVVSMDVYGDYLYVAVPNALFMSVYDISTITSPVEINRFGFGNAESVEVDGEYLYIGWFGSLKIYSLTNPELPAITSSLKLSKAGDIEIKDSLAFIAEIDSGLVICNIKDKSNPFKIDSISWFGSIGYGPYRLSVTNELILSAALSGMLTLGYETGIITEHSFFYTGGDAYNLKLKENVCYVASSGLITFDFSDPAAPVFLGILPTNEWAVDIALKGNYAFLLSSKSLSIIDISEPSNLIKTGELQIETVPVYTYLYSIAVSDSTAIITTGNNTITFINISDYSNPYIEYEMPVEEFPAGVFIYKNYLLSAENNSGLSIYDISELPPTKISGINSYLPASAVFAINDILYLAAGGSLIIYNIADPGNPVELSNVDPPGGSARVKLEYNNNGYLYMIYGYQLEIINIKNPYLPFRSGYYKNYLLGVWGVDSNKDLILISHSADGVSIFRNDLITGIKDEKYTEEINNQGFDIYPNPFNSQTNISFKLNESSNVKLTVYNLLGEECRTIVEKELNRGSHNYLFDAGELVSGIYIIRLETKNIIKAKKIILLR